MPFTDSRIQAAAMLLGNALIYISGLAWLAQFVGAQNAPVVGLYPFIAGDIIKIAMRRAYDFIHKEGLQEDIRLILQVHDELIYEMKEALVSTVAPRIQAIMDEVLTPAQTHGVPIIATIKTGKNWGEMKELE